MFLIEFIIVQKLGAFLSLKFLQGYPFPLDLIISLTAVDILMHRNVFTYRHISNSFIKLNYLTREIVCFDSVSVLLKLTIDKSQMESGNSPFHDSLKV